MVEKSAARILVVDDEAPLMKAICDTLRDRGYVTNGFTSGHAALETIEKGKFDLLISDLMMPELDGISLIQRALKLDSDLVAIMMTGEGTIASAVEAMKMGALDYILKPFKFSAVLPVITRALSIRTLRIENAELQRNLVQRTAELEITNQELEAFSYSISHDLRAPLRALDGFSKILLNRYSEDLPGDAKRLLGNIIASSQRMTQLIQDLLSLSRLGVQQIQIRTISMSLLVRETLEELQKIQDNPAIVVEVDDLPDCKGDSSLLKQVLLNLLSNAFKFTRHCEKPVVHVGGNIENEKALYFVRDNGVGFDMNYVYKIFGVFQRLHTQEEFEGTGVGLSIVRRIVIRHGGQIWAEAALNSGATFYFTLPI
jgi:two-component system sensor histidine kinase/response regulator